jgi:hypothetical protein
LEHVLHQSRIGFPCLALALAPAWALKKNSIEHEVRPPHTANDGEDAVHAYGLAPPSIDIEV